MKAKTLLMLVLAVAVISGCQNEKHELITRFENNINEHSFSAEGTTATGGKFTIHSRMEHYKTPGLSLSIVNDKEMDWERSYGFLEAGKSAMVDDNSIFQAGSVSKFVTALIVMHYVEKGLFDLDVDVNTYLKSWKCPRMNLTKIQM